MSLLTFGVFWFLWSFLEVFHGNLLPLAFGVEHGTLFDAYLVGEAGDDLLALFAAVAVDHRVEVVGPVGCGRAVVTVRDGRRLGHLAGDFVEALGLDLPGDEDVRREADLAVAQDGAHLADLL